MASSKRRRGCHSPVGPIRDAGCNLHVQAFGLCIRCNVELVGEGAESKGSLKALSVIEGRPYEAIVPDDQTSDTLVLMGLSVLRVGLPRGGAYWAPRGVSEVCLTMSDGLCEWHRGMWCQRSCFYGARAMGIREHAFNTTMGPPRSASMGSIPLIAAAIKRVLFRRTAAKTCI